MAGLAAGPAVRSPSSRYPGMTYGPQRGGYTPGVAFGVQNGQVVQSQPRTVVVPEDENPNTQFFGVNTVGQATNAGRSGFPMAPTTGAPARAAAPTGPSMSGLLDRLKRDVPFEAAPPPAPLAERVESPYDMAAERAGYGAAKERIGMAMQRALQGLKAAMAQRGIRGSTIERAGLENVFGGGLSDLAGVDRQLAENRADRAFTAEQTDLTRADRGREFDASFGQTEASRKQDAAMANLDRILRLYSMRGGLY